MFHNKLLTIHFPVSSSISVFISMFCLRTGIISNRSNPHVLNTFSKLTAQEGEPPPPPPATQIPMAFFPATFSLPI